MMSEASRKNWIDLLLESAEDNLNLTPPQLAACRAAMDFDVLIEQAAQAERAACAALANDFAETEHESLRRGLYPNANYAEVVARAIAAAIRARGPADVSGESD